MSKYYVDYIHATTMGSPEIKRDGIPTSIYPTVNTSFRLKYQSKGISDGGVSVGTIDATEDDDFRFFTFSSGYYDFHSGRMSGLGVNTSGQDYDLTFSNFQVYDNINERVIKSGTTQTTLGPQSVIYINPKDFWFKEIQIFEGEEMVFDGVAGVVDGNIGIIDTISKEFFYNPNVEMSYEGTLIPIFNAEADETDFTYTGGTSNITIESELAWTATTDADWISLSASEGTGDDTITATISSNSYDYGRTATINFINSDGDEDDIVITQAKHPLFIPYKKMYLGERRIN